MINYFLEQCRSIVRPEWPLRAQAVWKLEKLAPVLKYFPHAVKKHTDIKFVYPLARQIGSKWGAHQPLLFFANSFHTGWALTGHWICERNGRLSACLLVEIRLDWPAGRDSIWECRRKSVRFWMPQGWTASLISFFSWWNKENRVLILPILR